MSYNNQYPWEGPIDPDDYPGASATQPEERPSVTIKFGKGLVEEPFTSRAGKELVEIKIPNRDPLDKAPWESFVVPANFVHDNQYGKGVWIRLPADGMTRVSRSVLKGQDEDGKNIWRRESREVSNSELKSMMEAYKERKPRRSEAER